MTAHQLSWVASANTPDTDFPLNNLPYGVFAPRDGSRPRCGVAIGDSILDLSRARARGLITTAPSQVLEVPRWNEFMALGPAAWAKLRAELTALLANGAAPCPEILIAQKDARMLMPFAVSEYTDFYAGRHHATNVGTMFRGAENALPPNWLHIPIGYNGRASSVVVSGTDIRRPWGQVKGPDDSVPRFAPSARFDIELELGAIVGQSSDRPVGVARADEMIFGYVLLNDWSARDIQAWEYQPLGPFQSKATATSISPWIVTRAALAPFRCATPAREVALLPHLQDAGPMLYDIALEVTLQPKDGAHHLITATNYNQMYYSSAQQLAHHTTSGCPMNVGDLLGSGTISGPEKAQRGSLLELSWGGKEPLRLPDGQTRKFLQDGDTITMTGRAAGDGYQIGFGACRGTVLHALDDPFAP